MSGPRIVALSIDDFGLIRSARIGLAEGFTVFSGETGSGKTMLLGALSFALGARAAADVVRSGAARAVAAVEIDADDAVRAALDEAGFSAEPGELVVISREMSAQGKSAARINGRPASAAAVREIADRLVDFVGQHEQQRLLSAAYQTDILDRFAGPPALEERGRVERAYREWSAAAEEVAALSNSEERAAAEISDARFALREIDALELSPGDDDRLRERRDVLANAERIAQALASAAEALSEREGSALDRAGEAVAALGRVARVSARLQQLSDALASAESALNEVAVDVARERETVEFDQAELDALSERLDRIDRLKRRHGGSIESILAERDRLHAAVERFESRDEQISLATARAAHTRDELERAAGELSAKRRAAAVELEVRVSEELRALAMPSARFEVTFTSAGAIGPRGAERVEFSLAPNAGEPVRPLVRAASGGELSRVLLALVVVLADRRDRTALVFDEIDAGIGGATAAAVGERLGALARGAQVICVTHLAQIASWSDRHYTLHKRERAGETIIDVLALDDQAEVESEIARMLSGSSAKVALEHAGTLLRDARKRKGRLRISA